MRGSSRICCCVTVVPVETEPVSRVGAVETVVTVSRTPVTFIGTSSVSLSATRTPMFSRTASTHPSPLDRERVAAGVEEGEAVRALVVRGGRVRDVRLDVRYGDRRARQCRAVRGCDVAGDGAARLLRSRRDEREQGEQ